MKKYIMLCKKHITTLKEDKTIDKEFDTFFGYRQIMNTDGSFSDVVTPHLKDDGTSIMVSKAIKIALAKELFASLKDANFPIRVTLDDELFMDSKKEQPSFYVCINKDKDKNVIKDKNGKKHYILVIRKIVEYVEVERTPVTLDNFDDFE